MKARRTDLKFTQAEVRTIIALLVNNPGNPTWWYPGDWETHRGKLMQKFSTIDYRNHPKRKQKTQTRKTRAMANPAPDKSQLQFWEPGDIQQEAD